MCNQFKITGDTGLLQNTLWRVAVKVFLEACSKTFSYNLRVIVCSSSHLIDICWKRLFPTVVSSFQLQKVNLRWVCKSKQAFINNKCISFKPIVFGVNLKSRYSSLVDALEKKSEWIQLNKCKINTRCGLKIHYLKPSAVSLRRPDLVIYHWTFTPENRWRCIDVHTHTYTHTHTHTHTQQSVCRRWRWNETPGRPRLLLRSEPVDGSALSCRDGGDTTAFYFHPHYSACDSLLRSHSGGKRIGLNGSLVSSVWLREYECNYDLIPQTARRWFLPPPRKTFWCLKLHRFVLRVRNN